MTADKTSSINADGLYEPFSIDEVPWEQWSRGDRFGSRFRHLGRFGGGSHVGVVLEELPPGKQSCPVHFHMLEEEHIFILEGAVSLLLGDASHELKAGDYACFPAGQKAGHALINRGAETCRFLVIGESNPNEVVIYPRSGRVSVRLTGEGYRQSATMDYWEGESDGSEPAR